MCVWAGGGQGTELHTKRTANQTLAVQFLCVEIVAEEECKKWIMLVRGRMFSLLHSPVKCFLQAYFLTGSR